MEEYLEKWTLVYRKSYNFYLTISILISVSKFVLSATGLAAYVYIPLAFLSLSAGVVEIIEKLLSILERKEEYKQSHRFYKQLLNLWKAKAISEEEIYRRIHDYVDTLNYFPLERYLKMTQMNGYKYVNNV